MSVFLAILRSGDYEWLPCFIEEETEAQRHLPHLGACVQGPHAQGRTSSRSSTEARRICRHLCTSTLWNCFCRARISAHSAAVCGNLLRGVQGLSGALASSNLPKLLTPSGTHSPLGQGQTVPGLESVGCPLQGPKAVKEEDVEGDEDDEARGRGQRSRIGI